MRQFIPSAWLSEEGSTSSRNDRHVSVGDLPLLPGKSKKTPPSNSGLLMSQPLFIV